MIHVGSKVETSVSVAGERRPMAIGIVVSTHDGYCKVDIMSLHGGAPWIIDADTHTLREVAP